MKVRKDSSIWIDILTYFLASNRILLEKYNELLSSHSQEEKPPKLVLPALLFSDLKVRKPI